MRLGQNVKSRSTQALRRRHGLREPARKAEAAHAQLFGGSFVSSGGSGEPRTGLTRERTFCGDAEFAEDDVSDQIRRPGTHDVRDSGSSIAAKSQAFGSIASILCLPGNDDARRFRGKKTTLARTLERGKVVVPTTRRDLS